MFQVVQCPVTGEAKQVGENRTGEINGGPVIPQAEKHVVCNIFRGVQVVYQAHGMKTQGNESRTGAPAQDKGRSPEIAGEL